jgi:hypothetical protein
MMRFGDKLKSSKEKNTPAAAELEAREMAPPARLNSGRAGTGKATGDAQNLQGTEGPIPRDF